MNHVFHGFLGSPDDFRILKTGKNFKLHDLLEIDIQNLNISPEDTLIGYSMGGRIAIELAAKVNFKINKLILINAHPGIENDDEKIKRREWEDDILKKMSESNFLQYWNSLPVFKEDAPLLEIPTLRLEKFKEIFNTYRLSNQMNFLPLLNQYRDKVVYVCGKKDKKYFELTNSQILPLNIKCHFIESGHRAFQHPDMLMKIFKLEGLI